MLIFHESNQGLRGATILCKPIIFHDISVFFGLISFKRSPTTAQQMTTWQHFRPVLVPSMWRYSESADTELVILWLMFFRGVIPIPGGCPNVISRHGRHCGSQQDYRLWTIFTAYLSFSRFEGHDWGRFENIFLRKYARHRLRSLQSKGCSRRKVISCPFLCEIPRRFELPDSRDKFFSGNDYMDAGASTPSSDKTSRSPSLRSAKRLKMNKLRLCLGKNLRWILKEDACEFQSFAIGFATFEVAWIINCSCHLTD